MTDHEIVVQFPDMLIGRATGVGGTIVSGPDIIVVDAVPEVDVVDGLGDDAGVGEGLGGNIGPETEEGVNVDDKITLVTMPVFLLLLLNFGHGAFARPADSPDKAYKYPPHHVLK